MKLWRARMPAMVYDFYAGGAGDEPSGATTIRPGDTCAGAGLDYGGLNILAQQREQVNPRASPYCMDGETFEAHAAWARPMTAADVKNLQRRLRRASLADVELVIAHLLRRGLKLEQEAIIL